MVVERQKNVLFHNQICCLLCFFLRYKNIEVFPYNYVAVALITVPN